MTAIHTPETSPSDGFPDNVLVDDMQLSAEQLEAKLAAELDAANTAHERAFDHKFAQVQAPNPGTRVNYVIEKGPAGEDLPRGDEIGRLFGDGRKDSPFLVVKTSPLTEEGTELGKVEKRVEIPSPDTSGQILVYAQVEGRMYRYGDRTDRVVEDNGHERRNERLSEDHLVKSPREIRAVTRYLLRGRTKPNRAQI